jgi:hypothetical protein
MSSDGELSIRADHDARGYEAGGDACKQDWRVGRWASSDGWFRTGGREPVLLHCMPVVLVTVFWPDRRIRLGKQAFGLMV